MIKLNKQFRKKHSTIDCGANNGVIKCRYPHLGIYPLWLVELRKKEKKNEFHH
jgi:hypothetical protein